MSAGMEIRSETVELGDDSEARAARVVRILLDEEPLERHSKGEAA